MATHDAAETSPPGYAAICWALPRAGRERQRERAKKWLLYCLIHLPLHLAGYVLIIAIGIHLLVPLVSIKAGILLVLRKWDEGWPYYFVLLPVFALVFWFGYRLMIARESYEISDTGLAVFRKSFSPVSNKWKTIEAFKIENDPQRQALRLLKYKCARRSAWKVLPFDPNEVDEEEIRRRMVEHGVPDAAGGTWFARRVQ